MWADALIRIGIAWRNENCEAVVRETGMMLDELYTFPILFKPTFAVPQHTYRNNREDTLSYFAGPCAGMDHVSTDGGFALGFNVGDPVDNTTWQGFSRVYFHNMSSHTDSCTFAYAQGTMSLISRLTGQTHSFDTTFIYESSKSHSARPVLHHSSLRL